MTQGYNSMDSEITDGGSRDEQIRNEIQRRIAGDPFLRDRQIDMTVYHGLVSLRGVLPSPMAADLLVELAQGVPGVTEVNHDLLTVGDQPPAQVQTNIDGTAMPEDTVQTHDREVTVDEIIPAGIPLTGEEVGVLDTETVDEMRSVEGTNEDGDIASKISKGMDVVDQEGKKIGKVKEVRPSDFHLARGLLAKDFYVPYFACQFDGEKIILNIPASEVDKQGWAVPGHSMENM